MMKLDITNISHFHRVVEMSKVLTYFVAVAGLSEDVGIDLSDLLCPEHKFGLLGEEVFSLDNAWLCCVVF
jgi:hypothetical protein